MLHKSFKPAKCKTSLNLAKSRIKLMKNKKDIQLKQLKREVAQLLEAKQNQTARIRVEHVAREEKMIAAYEMIEIYCELAVVRLPIIESQKNCPLDLKEAIASLIFAAPRCGDITELQDVRKHFTAKYGKDFAAAAVELRPNCGVSRSLVEKLSVIAPDGPTKVKILTAIAEEHNIQWEPDWFKDETPVPSVDIPNVAAPTVEGNKIQMQPLNFEIADDYDEKHAHDTARPGTSFQSHSHSSSDLVPPSSTSRLDSRHSGGSSQKMPFSQSSGPPESAFGAGRQKWNMEFKDATAAAQAAAESAELASIAARAAAELSLRSNVMSESSSISSQSPVPGRSEEGRRNTESGHQHAYVHRNSTSGSFNQRSPKMKNQIDVNRPDNMREAGNSMSFNKLYAQFKEQYERENQELSESGNDKGYTRKSDSSPVASPTEPNMFKSSNFDEYEVESSENPFLEEPVEWKNQPSILQSQSSGFEDDYGIFGKLNFDKYEYDSGGEAFGSFSNKIGDHDDWHVRNAYNYGEEDMTFNDHRDGYKFSGAEDSNFKDLKGGSRVQESDVKDGFDSHRDIFVGLDHGISGNDNDEKSIQTDDRVVFDETDSDSDDNYVLNSTKEHSISSPSKLTQKSSLFNQDNPHFESDLSKSFRSSSLYSKLLEPLPIDFDSDEASSGDEKEQPREKVYTGVDSSDYQKPDASHHLEFMRPSDLGKRTADSFKTTEYVEENVNRYPSSEFEEGTQPRSEGGLELNLGSLPVRRQNRARWHIPGDELADAPTDTFDSSENSDFVSSHNSHKQKPLKNSGDYTHFGSPRHKQIPSNLSGVYTPNNNTELGSGLKDSDSGERLYSVNIQVPASRTSPKDPTGYFVSDESEPEEEPKPVTTRNFVSAGFSRRTKASTPRSKTSQSSSSYTSEVSSSGNVEQSSLDNHTTTIRKNSGIKVSKDDDSSYSPVAENSISQESSNVLEASSSINKAPTRENSAKLPSHVHPKLPDFETFTAHLQSLRKNRQ